MGQPVFHGGFNSIPTDGIIIGVALCLQGQPGSSGGNSSGITDDLRGESRTRINPLGSNLNLHAREHHGSCFYLDHRFIPDILGDDDGLGVEDVHLHLGIDCHDFQHGFLIDGIRDLVSGFQTINALFRCSVAVQVCQIVIGSPLIFPGGQYRI